MSNLGKKARDQISGFEGTITGHADYISGCNQSLITARVGSDHKSPEHLWVDDQRLEVLDDAPIVLDNSETPGHDLAAPIR